MSRNPAKKIKKKQNKNKRKTTHTGTTKSIRAPNAPKKFQPLCAASGAERPQAELMFLKQK